MLSQAELRAYDRVLVGLSGGKDSIACALHLVEAGVDASKIELHHHLVDGREGSTLMDWACTEDYVRQFARAFDLPIFYSWKMGGIEGEMLKENDRTAPTRWETPTGDVRQGGGLTGDIGTRLMFPQVCNDLLLRWCSSLCKIDVLRMLLRNEERFQDARTLVITGERRQESANRAKYNQFEVHKSDLRNGQKVSRHIDHYRPVIDWDETSVWEIMHRWSINPHPGYKLGFGRLSCMVCIFADENQLASVYAIAPHKILALADYEKRFGMTIHRTKSVLERVAGGTPYEMHPDDIAAALSDRYTQPIILPPGAWALPSGAFRAGGGPG